MRALCSGFLLAGLCLLLVVDADGAEFFVAPGPGSGGVGSVKSPWSLAYALSHPPAVHPGDTIWLRGGTYPGKYVSYLTGTSTAPIILRSYPGEWAKIDSGSGNPDGSNILQVNGAYAWYWGFEIMSSDPKRTTTHSGSWPTDITRGGCAATNTGQGVGVKFINLVCHDAAAGINPFKDSANVEVYGNIIYNNGWVGPDRGNGHAIYAQNASGQKFITDNIMLQSYDVNLHIYGSDAAPLQNITVNGNIIYQAAKVAYGTPLRAQEVVFGGGQVATNAVFTNNVLYTDPNNASLSSLGYGAGMRPAIVTGNIVSSGSLSVKFVNTLDVLTMTGNTFRGRVLDDASHEIPASRFPNNTYFGTTPPTGIRVVVRPNRYEAGRGHIAVLNWDLAPSVSVDVSSILKVGSSYEVRNAQNYFGAPVLSGTYAGGNLTLPMTGLTPAAPVGSTPPAPTGPGFNAFVVLPGVSAPSSPPVASFTFSPASPQTNAAAVLL